MRLTLGASMASILRQQLLDGVLLALAALGLALPAAYWTSQVVTAMFSVARPLPLAQSLAPGGMVFAAAVACATAIGLFVGVVPGWLALRTRPEDALRSTRTATPNHDRVTTLFLVAQVAVSLVLVVRATMLSGTLRELRANYTRLPVGDVLWTRLARNPGDKSGGVDRAYLQGLTDRLGAVSGVESAVLSAYFPAFLGYVGKLPQDDYSRTDMNSDGQPVAALTELASPGFFLAFGIAFTAGRDFTWDDDDSAPAVVVLNEAMASKLFPQRNGVGQSIRIGSGAGATDVTVVGVVADSTIGSLREPHLPVAFRPIAQNLARARFPLVHARVKGGVASVREGYVKAVEAPGRHFVRGLFTLEEWTELALLRERMAAGLAAWAAGLAVLLCGVGVYGLLACSVTARTREIGVRVAMGATATDVATMVIRKGTAIGLLGIAVGVPSALAAVKIVGAQVVASNGNYWRALIGGAVVFLVIAIAAAAIPGLRAAGIAPWEALRDQ
jgi:putative ABC transport system permease protein